MENQQYLNIFDQGVEAWNADAIPIVDSSALRVLSYAAFKTFCRKSGKPQRALPRSWCCSLASFLKVRLFFQKYL